MAKPCKKPHCNGLFVEPLMRCNVCNMEFPGRIRMKNFWKSKDRKYKPKKGDALERQKFYNSQHWRKIRKVYASKNPLCEVCLANGDVKSVENVHHIVPLSQGGSNHSDNLMSVCVSCHRKVEGKMPWEI